MAEIQKGKISKIEGPNDKNGNPTRARVLPSTSDGAPSRPYTIPWWLRGPAAELATGVEVAFATFDDLTGIILARMDGEGGATIPGDITLTGSVTVEGSSTVKGDETVTGGLTAGSVETPTLKNSGTAQLGTLTANSGTVGGVNVQSHKHTDSTGGSTSTPN